MTEIGKFNTLRIAREVDFGVYLDGGVLGEILLPDRYVPDHCEAGTLLEVFIYYDSEDRLIATTERPYAVVGEFAFLKVVSVSAVGAFLDWGLTKDVMVPFREQKGRMKTGESHLVRIYLDPSGRIAASAKLDQFLNLTPISYRVGEEVSLLIYHQTPIGYKTMINAQHWGMLYADDLFQALKPGQKVSGFIKKVRADHKIDLSLQKPGYERVEPVTGTIMKILEAHGGFLPVTDKSPPETIADLFKVSKKTFKKAIGALYKKRAITIEEAGIRINKNTAS